MTTNPIFRCRAVSAFFDKKQVLRSVDFDVEDRRVFALMGPSGCGKSTMLRTLNRMHEITPGATIEGQIEFEGKNLYDRGVDPVEVRARIGMVFQKPNPFPKSIFDNVAYAPRVLGLAKSKSDLEARVETALKRVALWTEVSGRLGESALGLSGGQQQRLVIARAIAAEPRAILLDEPCSALDPASTLRVEELIGELKEHFAVLIVTHSLAQAQRLADHIAFFHMGEMVEQGSPEKLLQNPDDGRVRDYLAGRTG